MDTTTSTDGRPRMGAPGGVDGWLVPAGTGTLGGGDTGRAREVRDLIQAGSSLIRDVVKSDSLGGAIGS